MSTFAGNTATVSASSPSADARRVCGTHIPTPRAISAAPLSWLASCAFGNQSGTIDSKKSGFAKCITPAETNRAPAAYGDQRDIGPVKPAAQPLVAAEADLRTLAG